MSLKRTTAQEVDKSESNEASSRKVLLPPAPPLGGQTCSLGLQLQRKASSHPTPVAGFNLEVKQ